jgi:hypothetical protein
MGTASHKKENLNQKKLVVAIAEARQGKAEADRRARAEILYFFVGTDSKSKTLKH